MPACQVLACAGAVATLPSPALLPGRVLLRAAYLTISPVRWTTAARARPVPTETDRPRLSRAAGPGADSSRYEPALLCRAGACPLLPAECGRPGTMGDDPHAIHAIPALRRRRFLQAGAACALTASPGRFCCREPRQRPEGLATGCCRVPPASAWSATKPGNRGLDLQRRRAGPGAAAAPRHAIPHRGREPAGQDTTVHWHGIRLPNAMDGVPGLTQQPIQPGGRFDYAFTPPDAGTFWYHSHDDSLVQMGRGLAGALIVEEPDPPPSTAICSGHPGLAAGPEGRSRPASTTAWKRRCRPGRQHRHDQRPAPEDAARCGPASASGCGCSTRRSPG